MSWPNECETGKACNAALTAPDYTSQGSQFLDMNAKFHGGRRSRRMRRMRGGAVAELASYPTSFEPSILPGDLHQTAGVAPLDKAIADLSQFRQMGGSHRTRRSRGGALGYGPVESGGPLISGEMEKYTFQNPQWYDENLVNPNFQGPSVPKIGGKRKGSRKHRKGSRKHRKGSRKHRKGSRKHRKGSRKH
jgi:hypothetical protein